MSALIILPAWAVVKQKPGFLRALSQGEQRLTRLEQPLETKPESRGGGGNAQRVEQLIDLLFREDLVGQKFPVGKQAVGGEG